MVAVEERNELYLFGGSGESGAMNDLFVFNILRQSWRQINVSGDQPCPRWSHECVYSPLDQKIYLFAGFGNLRLNDLWSFDLRLFFEYYLLFLNLLFYFIYLIGNILRVKLLTN